MRRLRFLIVLVILPWSLSYGSKQAFADGLIIRDGATLTLNDATLDLNCLDLTIEDGGTLNLGSGTIAECGPLIVSSGGNLILGTGRIYSCQGGVDNDYGCFITVAAYGSPIDQHVNVLREFRKCFLLNK